MAPISRILGAIVAAAFASTGVCSILQEPLSLSTHVASPVEDVKMGASPVSYGNCYLIKNDAGEALGSGDSGWGYYKFGAPEKIFQVWKSRAFAEKSGGYAQNVPDGGSFYLWDPVGSNYSNGGRWIATNPTATYAGASGYQNFVKFRITPDDGGFVNLGIAKFANPSLSNYHGLVVRADKTLHSSASDKSVRVRFQRVDCRLDEDDI